MEYVYVRPKITFVSFYICFFAPFPNPILKKSMICTSRKPMASPSSSLSFALISDSSATSDPPGVEAAIWKKEKIEENILLKMVVQEVALFRFQIRRDYWVSSVVIEKTDFEKRSACVMCSAQLSSVWTQFSGRTTIKVQI